MTTDEMQSALDHMGLDVSPRDDGCLFLTTLAPNGVRLSPQGVDMLIMYLQRLRAPYAEPGEG